MFFSHFNTGILSGDGAPLAIPGIKHTGKIYS